MSYTVIYAGTFDPITNGHLDIIERASELFGQVIVAVAKNPSKQPLFSLEERTALVRQSCAHLANVQAVGFSGLLADFAKQHQAKALVRGIRGSDDIEYEIQLAQLNDKLSGRLDTVFLPPSVTWRYLSSTMVREIYRHQGDVAQFVPNAVLCALKEKE
ncbi:phosphopantetheine adenylyltransferase [Actinobacillus lignieresii]|uniref:pantetheine-phosphate adenylyltransferase n=1 Tax=Actinobacillus lignieresii TaxID=720 RepID=UPI000F71336F|nr:pantetheine-phosphate adenylyltransferase [Actinobacillus lignieresii]VEB26678.1 phosphopantetheine adenylyltransferase [Actinobacillus lignieresii]